MPALSRLGPVAASAFGLQTILAAIFVPRQDERFYDMGGAAGFLSTTFVSLCYPYLRGRQPLPQLSQLAPRQLLLNAAMAIWATRLGYYLGTRAIQAGGDSRFEEIKRKPSTFTFFWLGQATWIFVVGLPVYLANATPARLHPRLNAFDFAAIAFASTCFGLEVLADSQKAKWKRDKNAKLHDEKFISSGLWGISRHPNHVAEVGIWTGVWALSFRSLASSLYPAYTPLLALASPLMAYILVRRASGVPPLEEQAEKRWGNDKDWQEYKRRVPVFFPWLS